MSATSWFRWGPWATGVVGLVLALLTLVVMPTIHRLLWTRNPVLYVLADLVAFAVCSVIGVTIATVGLLTAAWLTGRLRRRT